MLLKSTAAALALSITSITALAPASAAPLRSSAASTAASQWSTTPTQAFTAKNLTDLGAVSASMPMHVAVGLQLSNRAAAMQLLKSMYTPHSANFHHFLTPAQFNAMFAPSPATASAMAQYLASAGLTNVSVAPNRQIVTATGTAASVGRAFDTSIHAVRGSNGFTTFANISAAKLPAAFTGLVSGIVGLNGNAAHKTLLYRTQAGVNAALAKLPAATRSQLRTNAFDCGGGIAAGPTCVSGALSMNQMAVAYGDRGTTTGGNTNVGVFTSGSLGTVVNDLRLAEAYNGRAQVPVSVINIGGPSTDTSGDDEWDLDTQASTGVAIATKSLTLFNAPTLDDYYTTAMYNKWVSDDIVQTASASYSGCEVLSYEDGQLFIDDNIFFQGVLQGQSIFASSGDTGGSCLNPAGNGIPAGVPGVGYPSSSPFVVSVGGTTLYVNSTDGTYYSELGWYAGGGGPSAVEIDCPFQQSVLECTGTRPTPDIALAADPNLGSTLSVIVSGTAEGVGGTSLSAPLANGIYSRFVTRLGSNAGSALPALYNAYAYWNSANAVPLPSGLPVAAPVSVPISLPGTPSSTNPGTITIGGFNDVVAGDNVPWPTKPGYDYVTGLGSLNIEVFVDQYPIGVQ